MSREMWNETAGDEDEDDKVGFENDLHEFFAGFNCYDIIQAMEDKDVNDLFAIERYFQSGTLFILSIATFLHPQ